MVECVLCNTQLCFPRLNAVHVLCKRELMHRLERGQCAACGADRPEGTPTICTGCDSMPGLPQFSGYPGVV